MAGDSPVRRVVDAVKVKQAIRYASISSRPPWHILRNLIAELESLLPGEPVPDVTRPVEAERLKSRLMGIDDGEDMVLHEVWDKWLELDCDKVLFTQWLSERMKEAKNG